MTGTAGKTTGGAPDDTTGATTASGRTLGEPFLAALEVLSTAPHGGWWADVLCDPDLLLAVRARSLNVYYRGASLFRVLPTATGTGAGTATNPSTGIVAETHAKYLLRQRQALVRLAPDGGFVHDPAQSVWTRYEGSGTLAEMKRAAAPLVGLEKAGVHALVQASSNVIDVEIALRSATTGTAAAEAAIPEPDGASADAALLDPEAAPAPAPPAQDRLDVASLEARGQLGEAWLVFHEAKLAASPALRSTTKPAIVAQVERYRATLTREAERLAAAYPALCRDLVRLDALRRQARTARGLDPAGLPLRDPLVAEVAAGTRTLYVDPEPRLVLFGFDADQKDGALRQITQTLRETHGLRVYAVGKPVGRTAAAFRRPANVGVDPTPDAA